MSSRYEFVPISDSDLFTISEHFGIVPSELKTNIYELEMFQMVENGHPEASK